MKYAIVLESTDGKHVGERWPLPGVESAEDITAELVESITGRFAPDTIAERADGTVRMSNSSYSITIQLVE